MSRKDKIQHLIISHLLDVGHIQLTLPDGMVVELGINKEDKNGKLKATDDYCWVIASQKQREVSIDSYNLGLRFNDDNGKMILEDSAELYDGKKVRCFNVI